jgi:hypothetical protein
MIDFAPGLSGCRVALDGKFVGVIRQVEGGWQYYPKAGHGACGEKFPSLYACQLSLLDPEGEES